MDRGGAPRLLVRLLCLHAVACERLEDTDGKLEALGENLACSVDDPNWRRYYEVYDVAARATSGNDPEERNAARAALADELAERTSNITDILNCNVGVVAGYYLLARLISPLALQSMGVVGTSEGEANLAYRLLQMALIFIFTLRNGNKIPRGPGAAWGVHEQFIIPSIMHMKKGHDYRMRERLRRSVPIAPTFRDRSLRIAVVSICAYPPDHPIALPKVTPPNRDAYTSRHGYDLRLHLERPIIGAHDLGMQHAKLATMLAYMQQGEFDWIAWFDCDSIIMNMDRTLDSIIYQYAQQTPARSDGEPLPPVCGEDPPPPDLAGEWLDAWVPEDLRLEAAVVIEQDEEGRLSAASPSFGEATGNFDSDAAEVEMIFDGSPLKGRLVVEGETMRLEWDNGSVWTRVAPIPQAAGECREPCTAPADACAVELDPDINLLITEEGWGLSSANWLIRSSPWSMEFLNNALTSAHVELQLFGDQDAIILHVMNQEALRAAARAADEEAASEDPLSRHACIVPQFELNSYDSLNALTMECDAFVEGDLLVTFPQCKDAEGCNDVFNLAADYAKDEEKDLDPWRTAWWSRKETEPLWSRYNRHSSPSIRVFGPRPLIRQIFLRERHE